MYWLNISWYYCYLQHVPHYAAIGALYSTCPHAGKTHDLSSLRGNVSTSDIRDQFGRPLKDLRISRLLIDVTSVVGTLCPGRDLVKIILSKEPS